jgi:hypothetical protein
MRVRVRRTSWHTVQAQHRALATIGKLAAEHSRDERPPDDAHASKSAVRVVRGEGSGSAPAEPPALRSRPRRSPTVTQHKEPGHKEPEPEERQAVEPPDGSPLAAPRRKEVLPGPSVKLVHDQVLEPLPAATSRPAPAVPRAVLPIIPSMRPVGSPAGVLRFDSLADREPPKQERSSPPLPKPLPVAATLPAWVVRPLRVSPTTIDSLRKSREDLASLIRRCGPVTRRIAARGRSVMSWLSSRPRAVTGAAASLLVLAAIAGLAANEGSSSTHHPTASGQRPTHQAAAGLPPAPGAGLHQPAQAGGALFEMTSSNSATYQVTGPISVVLDATGPCWVQARRAGPTGGLLFQGTLVPGQSWTVAGPTWLRLGNPTAVNLTVNGELVSPPADQGIPFDLQIG